MSHATLPARDSIIACALSGGVDSAVAAGLLVRAGYRAVGVTMRLHDARGAAATGRCCGPRDVEDARRVCHHLDIPFYVVDFAADFEHLVIDDFVQSYLAGETPNPCIKCNQHIKFTPLARYARSIGAAAVATGHYARIQPDDRGHHQLLRGADPRKDQSYFLFPMPARELASTLFPLGDMDKDTVRRHARSLGLPNAEKPESQEICFVPDNDYAAFVGTRALRRGLDRPAPGDIVDDHGRVLGRHDGVHHFTIGQRRGLGGVGGPTPVYVTDIDRAGNRVVVGSRAAAARSELELRDVHWLVSPPGDAFSCLVQVRHRAAPVAATVTAGTGGTARVRLEEPLVAAPGQAAVLYDGDVVLGGGWIRR